MKRKGAKAQRKTGEIAKESAAAGEYISHYKSLEGYEAVMAAYDAVLKTWPIPHETRMVQTQHGSTHVIISGREDAPPLVLLHGAIANASTWIFNAEGLGPHFRLYAIDMLGETGKSAQVRLSRRGSGYGEWLADVLTGLGLQQPDIVGLSLGGWLAIKLALHAPERIRRLVLLCPAMIVPLNNEFTMRAGMSVLMPTRENVYGLVRFLTSPNVAIHEELVPVLELIFRHHRPNLEQPPVFTDDELRQLTMPTLMLVGEHDVIYKPSTALERAQQLIPNLQTELIANAGHGINIDQAEIVNSRIIDFLNLA